MSGNKSSDSSEKKRPSTVFTDSADRYLGSSHKGLFGEEIYLDSSGHYVERNHSLLKTTDRNAD